jgi:hypothetical protein
MSSVEFLVKLRDAAQLIADAANEQLEKMAPPDPADFDKLAWTAKEGSKGPYEQTTKAANQDTKLFQQLQQVLSDHDGFCQISDYKYWFDRDDKNVIDRRKK